jgi:hypothetical protein
VLTSWGGHHDIVTNRQQMQQYTRPICRSYLDFIYRYRRLALQRNSIERSVSVCGFETRRQRCRIRQGSFAGCRGSVRQPVSSEKGLHLMLGQHRRLRAHGGHARPSLIESLGASVGEWRAAACARRGRELAARIITVGTRWYFDV